MNKLIRSVVPLVTLGIAYKLDHNNPTVRFCSILLFTIGQTIVCAGLLMAYLSIKAKNETRIILVPSDRHPAQVGMAAAVTETTIYDYDIKILCETAIQKVGVPIIVMMIIYWKTGSLIPLILQGVNSPIIAYQWELIQIHLLGRQAVGALLRPFAVASHVDFFTGGMSTIRKLTNNKSLRKIKKDIEKNKKKKMQHSMNSK
eukprot:Tbor_TRINITY_DN7588_c0_g1::TRINITY_DN7588_c0_g1_i1::g.914::m.914